MKKLLGLFIILSVLFFPMQLSAQLTVIQGSFLELTPEQFINTYLMGSGVTVVPGSASFNGNNGPIGSNQVLIANQIGTFQAIGSAYNSLRLQGGIIMSSGNVADAPRGACFPPCSCGTVSTGTDYNATDPDLVVLMEGAACHDKCILEFDFIPQTDIVTFRYVFASEEFDDFCPTAPPPAGYNDAFGFLMSGPLCGTTPPNIFTNNAENVALLPSTADYVSIRNICQNKDLYSWCNISNCPNGCESPNGSSVNFSYDRFTNVLTASKTVVACSTYHMKICIGDAGDDAYDSGVFLEQNSFSSNNITFNNTYSMPALGEFAVEGCSNATVSFLLGSTQIVDQTINFVLGGTATPDGPGVPNPDYGSTPTPTGTPFPTSVVIPAGQLSASLTVYPYLDGITPEPDETVTFSVTNITCSGQTTITNVITIKDNNGFSVSINPQPPVCSGVPVSLTAMPAGGQPAYTYLWSNGATGNPVTLSNPPVGSNTISVTATDGCTSTATGSTSFTVKPLPAVTSPVASSTTLCSGQTLNIPIESTPPGSDFTWTINCNPLLIEICPTSTGGPVINDQLTLKMNSTPATVDYLITPTLDGCAGSVKTHTINVISRPTPNIEGTSTLCEGTSGVVYTTEMGFNDYTWTISPGGTITAGGTTESTTATVTWNLANVSPNDRWISVSYTDLATNCTSLPVVKYVTVNAIPNVVPAVPSPLTICSGTDAQVALSSTVASTETSTTFAWSASGNAATITPDPSTISGTGNILQNLANSGNILEPVVFHITPTSNGCSPASPTDFTFNVNPVPSVQSSPVSPQVLCSATASSPIALSTNVTGITPSYNWSSVCDPGLTSCPPAAGSGTPIATFSPVNATTSQKNVSFSITASLPASSGTCTGPIAPYTVKVNARPNITNTILSQEVCSGIPSTAVVLTADITGTTFAWSSSASAGITGNTTSGSGDIPVQTLLNSTSSQGSVTYTITPSFVQDGLSCTGPVKIYTIYVNPLPVPTASGPVSVCEGTPGSVYTTQAGMASYTWTVSAAGTITAGGTSASSSVTVTWNTALPGQFIEVNYLDLKGCTALAPYHLNVTVNPTPVLAVTGTNDLCAGSNSITYSTTPGMTSYAWTISAGGTPVGSTTSSTVTVNWAPNASASQSVSVAYTNSLGCSGLTNYPVTIQPLPVSTFTGTTTVCQLHPSPYLYTADAGPACSYTWSITPPSAGTIVNPAVSPASVTWNNPGSATLALVAVTPFGCNTSSSQPVTINPRPEVSITPCFDVVTNRSAQTFLLKGGRPLLTSTPLQGEYLITPATPALTSDASGNFWFNPAMVPGTNTVTFALSYRYTSSQFGCPATSPTSVTLTVRAANPPCGTSMTDFRDNTTYRTSFLAGRCWMMENLRYGSLLSPITTAQTDNCTTEKYCLSTDATCTAYGGLYQWDELIQYGVTAGPQYQGVCPGGWHIPTAADYQALIDANQGNGIAGSFLTDLNLNPRGFEALLRGMAYLNTAWAFTPTDIPAGTLFWTSSPGSANRIITRGMNSKVQSVQYYEAIPADAFPVRCVKD